MNSQQIQYFFSSAQYLSFSRAAEEHFTSQPTVSRQIAALEEELGFPLFLRTGKQLRLTSGGMVMLAEFRSMQASLQESVARVSRIQNGLEGHLSIGYLTGMDTNYYVYPPTKIFTDQYPHISVDLESGTFRILRQQLQSKEFDIIFTYHFEISNIPDSLSQLVYTTDSFLIVSARHPLSKKDALTPEDLRGQTFIIPSAQDSDGRRAGMIDTLIKNFGCTEEELAGIHLQTTDSLDTKMFQVLTGSGIGIVGNCMSLVREKRYTLFPLPQTPNRIYAVWHKDNLNPAIPLYLETLTKAYSIDVFSD